MRTQLFIIFRKNREKEVTLTDLLNAKKLIIDMQGREKILKEQL